MSANKRAKLHALLDSTSPDIVLGCETKLNDNINDQEIFPPNYKLFRKDRTLGGGGVLLAYRDTILATEIQDNSNCEIKWAHITATHNKSLIFGIFYRPPNSPTATMDALRQSVENVRDNCTPNTPIYLCGDFNLKDIDWTTLSNKPRAAHPESCKKLTELISDFSLEQMVTVPTRGSAILDLVITNKPDTITNLDTTPGLSTVNDHDIVTADILCSIPINRKTPRLIYQWNRGDITGLRNATSDFALDYLRRAHTRPVNDNFLEIQSFLQNAQDKFIPTKLISGKYSYPWITSFLKKKIYKRRRLYSSLLKEGLRPRDIQHYTYYSKLVDALISDSYWKYVNNLFDNQANDVDNKKNLFKFVKSQRKDQCGTPPFKHMGKVITDSKTKANLMNDYFTSIFTENEDTNIPNKGPSPHPTMPKFEITHNGVYKLISNLKTKKATGPDNIPAILLKNVVAEITPVIVSLFRQSLDSGILPNEFKKANVTPIHKKGSGPKSIVKNYRPISLTSILSKCLEHILASQFMNHLERNNILTSKQHGFRKRRSTVTQLLLTCNDFADSLNKRSQVDGILLDFSKAFDKVSHKHLLYKLKFYGLRGNYLNWAESFLSNRTQKTLIDGQTSTQSNVKSGVPQGTVLGPLFFLCFINDLPEVVSSQIRLFADDALIYRQIDSPADYDVLQTDLNSLSKWSRDWCMEFNSGKCFVLTTTLKTKPLKFTYKMSGKNLESVKSHPYLGVTLDSKLSWTPHLNSVTAKATRSLNFLSRNFHNCPPHIKETAYNIYVRPQLEYASQVWSPQTITGKRKIENIQSRAGRFVTKRFKYTESITEIISSLNWQSLENRRNITDIITCHKILHNKLEVPTQNVFIPHTSHTRSDTQPFKNIVCSVDAAKNSYFPRTISRWNKLPPNIGQMESENSFKRAATAWLQNQ